MLANSRGEQEDSDRFNYGGCTTRGFRFFHTHTRYRLLPETEPCTTFHYLSIGCELMLDHIELPALHTIPTVFALSNQGQEELKNIWMSLLEAFTNASITITDPASPHHLPQAASFLLLRARTMEWLSLVFTFLKSNTFLEQQHDPRVTTICSFVQTNYPHTLTLSDLAKRVYVSSSYLSHLFVQSIGVAPMEYVRLTRMKKAKYFLIHTAASIREIAEETGYESQSHFSRAFRTFEGISPLQYRKRWRGY